MGGGRIPGPIRNETHAGDPFGSGFTDPIPLGGGSGQASVKLAGWPKDIAWSAFREVESAPDGASEAAQIESVAVQPDQVQTAQDGGRRRLASYTVTVKIVRDTSWVVTSQKSAALLKHEQGHFDIVGLTARDMVADLDAVRADSPEDLQQQVTEIIARTGALAKKLDDLYDGDENGGTNHGSNAAAQTRWDTHLKTCKDSKARLTDGPSKP